MRQRIREQKVTLFWTSFGNYFHYVVRNCTNTSYSYYMAIIAWLLATYWYTVDKIKTNCSTYQVKIVVK